MYVKSIAGYLELIKANPEIFSNANAAFRIITDCEEIMAWQEEERKKLIKKGLPVSWSDIGIVLDDPFVLLLRDLVEFPGGKRGGYIGENYALLPTMAVRKSKDKKEIIPAIHITIDITMELSRIYWHQISELLPKVLQIINIWLRLLTY